ncbi:fused isobutyryl-CoA mutase/GTPase IcmF [Pseudomonadota bacterium]
MTQPTPGHQQTDKQLKDLPIRFLTATSLFDGHDASINIMRRILQQSGAEVIHLGHDRSVQEVVDAAIQEDVDAVAISSYQGGHVEYFKYMVDQFVLRQRGNIRIFGGGGGVIIPSEIDKLEKYGVCRIYSPEDGQQLGLQGIIDDMLNRCQLESTSYPSELGAQDLHNWDNLARLLSCLENSQADKSTVDWVSAQLAKTQISTPLLGITGTGGSGKSSLTDELVLRFKLDYQDRLRIGIIAIDPSRKKTGGALLGDRIRMNAINSENIFMRSVATRSASGEVPEELSAILDGARLGGFDLLIIETPGIGQGDSAIVELVDCSLYVMTPEFGAASQLEKIEMLDFADFVAINKFDRRGAEDALRDVKKQVQRNRQAFGEDPASMAVFGTNAAHFNDRGVSELYLAVRQQLQKLGLKESDRRVQVGKKTEDQERSALIPGNRQRYLAEIAEQVRNYHERVVDQSSIARALQQLQESNRMLSESDMDTKAIEAVIVAKSRLLKSSSRSLLEDWHEIAKVYSTDSMELGDSESGVSLTFQSLSGSNIPKIALPKYSDQGDLLRWLMLENLPGYFPFTAGVFPFKRQGEDPTRMFAGVGDAARTNRRFKYLSEHSQAKRLSTAFDSVTLYGSDPDERPDIFGKVGNSGVSIASLEDLKELYSGFDLCDPQTSVSMTINGPAPTILAMFLNVAIDQQLQKFESKKGRKPTDIEKGEIVSWTLANVRGTVQADILKEDQGQNTCIFSTEFSLKVMGDIQEYFIQNNIRNFYSVSISGYHIAEAGANPVTQLALTLANGFTYVEAYLARGMDIDDFAPNLSFFFSNGLDPEYSVMGRVARRIWAIAMREIYGANERSQKLKYHIQTSGRSLHAQEMDFNDIRTTLQALIAVYDNCNSLHTNAHDEAITTPSEDSLRRALAIQLIINREWGLAKNENPNQGAFIIDELTDLVEEAVLEEFERIAERGGVLGAMETGYQRGKIQDESLYYEKKKHDGSLPIVGVNTFIKPKSETVSIQLSRSTLEEKKSQISRLREFHSKNSEESGPALTQLQKVAVESDNVFAELVRTVRCCSLGEITNALFEVGGKYRRNT